jgi:hypothetical protein
LASAETVCTALFASVRTHTPGMGCELVIVRAGCIGAFAGGYAGLACGFAYAGAALFWAG